MNTSTEQFQETLLAILSQQALALERLANAIERLAPTTPPNHTYPLESFKAFDWEAIGATVEGRDGYGATVVSWRGQQFIRRSPSNKFGEAIWYSRCVGKGENGENRYERLITFKRVALEVEPVPERVRRFVN